MRECPHEAIFLIFGIQDGRQMDYILCFSVILLPMDSEMAGPIGLKLGGMVESIHENVLTKAFF